MRLNRRKLLGWIGVAPLVPLAAKALPAQPLELAEPTLSELAREIVAFTDTWETTRGKSRRVRREAHYADGTIEDVPISTG